MGAVPFVGNYGHTARSCELVLRLTTYCQKRCAGHSFRQLFGESTARAAAKITGKLRNVSIRLKDTWQPNTTYVLLIGDAIHDVKEHNPFKNFPAHPVPAMVKSLMAPSLRSFGLLN